MLHYIVLLLSFASLLFANIPPPQYITEIESTTASGTTTTITKTYDELNRLSTVTDAQGTTRYEYAPQGHFLAGSGHAIGRQTNGIGVG